MTCRKSPTFGSIEGSGKPSGGGYATEAECLQACKEGACCEGTTCSVKPQCQCQGTGKVFRGVGTTCEPNLCNVPCCTGQNIFCEEITATACVAIGGVVQSLPCSQSARACCLYYYSTRPLQKGTCCRNVPVFGSGGLSGTVVGYRCSSLTMAECAAIGGSFCVTCSSGERPAGTDEYGAYNICSNPLP